MIKARANALGVFVCALLLAASAHAAGSTLLTTASGVTGEKPQSKLFFHDGTWWAVLRGPSGVGIYEKTGDTWQLGTFADAVLTPNGNADVKCDGDRLYVLVYTTSPQFFELTYDTGLRVWNLQPGFPVAVPNPAGSETMVLESDSAGRVWTVAEGGGSIQVFHTTNSSHTAWSASPIILQTGVYSDDIASVVAFGGDRIGVLWSDQNRDDIGFRVHHDADDPSAWDPIEIVDHGPGHADDHLNLAFDSQGRVYAISKDDYDTMSVHRRAAGGGWTTYPNVLGQTGTRGIIMISEGDARAYIVYTNWEASPDRIDYRFADLETLTFGSTTVFMAASSVLNNVTGTKQILPAGCLMAAAEDAGQVWWNGWGTPIATLPPPLPPENLTAAVGADPARVTLAWSPASGSSPDGYDVYRQVDGGTFERINTAPVATPSHVDFAPPSGSLCYRVDAIDGGGASAPSATACVDNAAVDAPGPPTQVTAVRVESGSTTGALVLWFDAGSGQWTPDLSGHGNNARLGSSESVDASDPVAVEGVAGGALAFDGVDDYLNVAHQEWLSMTGSFTVEAWVRHTLGKRGVVLCKGTSSKRTYRVVVSASGAVEFAWDNTSGSKRETIASAAILDDAWHHVACVYDQAAGQNRVYVDGVLRKASSASGAPFNSSASLYLGTRLSSLTVEHWNGRLDQIRIAPGVLYASDFTPPWSAPPDYTDATASALVAWQPPTDGGTPAWYTISRSTSSLPWTPLATVLTTSYTDPAPGMGEHCYRITALNAQSEASVASASVCLDLATGPVGAPESLQVMLRGSTPESAALAWSAPASGPAPSGYHVYRRNAAGDFTPLTASPVVGFAFADSPIVVGTHCYLVRGVDAQFRLGAPSDTACVAYVPPPAPLGAPLDVIVVRGDSILAASVPGAAAFGCDEGSGQSITDLTGHGHTMQLGGDAAASSYDPVWSPGIAGGALFFDGKNDRTRVEDAVDLRFAGSFTVEAWIQRASFGTEDCIASKGDSGKRNFYVMLNASNQVQFVWQTSSGADHGTTSTTTLTDSAWHHVACVYDQAAGQNRIYVDGVRVHTASDAGNPITDTSPVYFGIRLSGGSSKSYFHGSLDLPRLSSGAVYDADFVPATNLATGGTTVPMTLVTWTAPASGTPAGYFVSRQVDGGAFERLNAERLNVATYVDLNPPAGTLCYVVTAADVNDVEGPASDVACAVDAPTKSAPASDALPLALALHAGPNPFNPTTTIHFDVPHAGPVELAVYDVRGHRLATLVSRVLPAGAHALRWNAHDDAGRALASGIYFARLHAANSTHSLRLVLVR